MQRVLLTGGIDSFQEGDFTEAEAYASNAISQSALTGLQDGELQRVASTLKTLLIP